MACGGDENKLPGREKSGASSPILSCVFVLSRFCQAARRELPTKVTLILKWFKHPGPGTPRLLSDLEFACLNWLISGTVSIQMLFFGYFHSSLLRLNMKKNNTLNFVFWFIKTHTNFNRKGKLYLVAVENNQQSN